METLQDRDALIIAGAIDALRARVDDLAELAESALDGPIEGMEPVTWAAGASVDYLKRGSMRGVLVFNLASCDAYFGDGPGKGTANRSLLTLPARSWARLPLNGSTVSIGGALAGRALIVPLSTAPEPAIGGLYADGRYNAAAPTLVDGERGDLQLDAHGSLKTTNADTPTVIKSVAAVAIVAGAGATIWAPAAGKRFRLMGWSLSASAAASLIFGDNVVGAVILRSELVGAAGISQTPPGFGKGVLSAAADNVLKLDVTANATVSGFVFGTEE